MRTQFKTAHGFVLLTLALAFTPACDDPDGGYGDSDGADTGDTGEAVARDEAPGPDAVAQEAPTSEAAYPCRILALGDSLTYGWSSNPAQQNDPTGTFWGGYRAHLVASFAQWPSASVGPILMVGVRSDNSTPLMHSWGQAAHAGAPGFTNAQLAYAVSVGASSVAPDIILLHGGTNDILTSPAPKHAHALSNLNALLGQLRLKNPDATILLAKIIPLAGPLGAEVALYNAQLDAVAAARRAIGQDVWTVDHHTGFPAATLLDGIHPDWSGYATMAWRWRAALDAVGCAP